MKSIVKNKNGFSLLEVMVTVAIIGILGAVAYPKLKKYQSKVRANEGKVELAAAYSALKAFHFDFSIYHTCLAYMGYNPSVPTNRLQNMYYAIGFREYPNVEDTNYDDAEAEGMSTSACPDGAAAPAIGSNLIRFIGEMSIGSSVMTDPLYRINATPTASGLCTVANIDANSYIHCIGTQADASTQTFVLPAVGVIDPDNVAAGQLSIWTINQKKEIKNIRPGY